MYSLLVANFCTYRYRRGRTGGSGLRGGSNLRRGRKRFSITVGATIAGCSPIVAGTGSELVDHERLKLSAGLGAGDSGTSLSRRPCRGGLGPPGKKRSGPDLTTGLG